MGNEKIVSNILPLVRFGNENHGAGFLVVCGTTNKCLL